MTNIVLIYHTYTVDGRKITRLLSRARKYSCMFNFVSAAPRTGITGIPYPISSVRQ